MAGLESIVRPFVRPDSLATRKLIASREQVEVTDATISWGEAGTLAAAHEIDQIDPTGLDFTVKLIDEEYIEQERKTDVRRIEQTLPNGTTNPDNFVDLDRPYKITFKKMDPASSRPNQTQVWSTSIETANFKTLNPNKKDTNSRFNLNRSLA